MLSIRAFVLAAILLIIGAAAADTKSTTSEEAYSACPTPRIRKSWDMLTADEKKTYKSAVAQAMDSGMYERFLSMHRELFSIAQGDSSCGYLYWHRQYLLGFENMLRSLGPKYACVTVPYYDFVFDNLKFMTKKCTDIASCSSIVNELGSTPRTTPLLPHISLIGGIAVTGRCDKAEPNNHFCEWQNPRSILCSKCVPRGPYHLSRFPCSVNPHRLRQILYGSKDFTDLSTKLQWGPSLFMHFHLLGALASPFVSPADPLYFPLHATIDALHSIYYNCRVRHLNLSDLDKQNNPLVFKTCMVAGVFPLTSTSTITMNAITNGINVVDVRSPSQPTAPYFKTIPNKYYQLADTLNLNDNSYDYEFTGPLRVLRRTCGGCGLSNPGAESCVVENVKADQSELTESVDEATELFFKWRSSISFQCSVQDLSSIDCEFEMQKVLVLFYHNCLNGGDLNVSASFKAAWSASIIEDGATLLQDLLSGRIEIKLEAFGKINQQFFQCSGDAY
ncbi:hypothetical protein THRCLA_03789 [Thraustotheca clavata]|uniref:Secreted protein n=1 Tax=Thraustotheca clavata TaxID=74557 RepID=A0A0A7CM13_9STRA|nr:secreted protein [Thraustotheca clavata]OQS03928.1 hypothetical protein THRCLA_03789 [Thraustotheca clavata]